MLQFPFTDDDVLFASSARDLEQNFSGKKGCSDDFQYHKASLS